MYKYNIAIDLQNQPEKKPEEQQQPKDDFHHVKASKPDSKV